MNRKPSSQTHLSIEKFEDRILMAADVDVLTPADAIRDVLDNDFVVVAPQAVVNRTAVPADVLETLAAHQISAEDTWQEMDRNNWQALGNKTVFDPNSGTLSSAKGDSLVAQPIDGSKPVSLTASLDPDRGYDIHATVTLGDRAENPTDYVAVEVKRSSSHKGAKLFIKTENGEIDERQLLPTTGLVDFEVTYYPDGRLTVVHGTQTLNYSLPAGGVSPEYVSAHVDSRDGSYRNLQAWQSAVDETPIPDPIPDPGEGGSEQVKQIEQELATLRVRQASLQQSLISASTRLSHAEAAIVDHDELISQRATVAADYQNALDEEDFWDQRQKELRGVRSTMTKAEYNNLRDTAKANEKAAKNQAKEYKSELSSLDRTLRTSNRNTAARQTEVGAAHSGLAAIDATIAQNNSDITRLEQQLAELTGPQVSPEDVLAAYQPRLQDLAETLGFVSLRLSEIENLPSGMTTANAAAQMIFIADIGDDIQDLSTAFVADVVSQQNAAGKRAVAEVLSSHVTTLEQLQTRWETIYSQAITAAERLLPNIQTEDVSLENVTTLPSETGQVSAAIDLPQAFGGHATIRAFAGNVGVQQIDSSTEAGQPSVTIQGDVAAIDFSDAGSLITDVTLVLESSQNGAAAFRVEAYRGEQQVSATDRHAAGEAINLSSPGGITSIIITPEENQVAAGGLELTQLTLTGDVHAEPIEADAVSVMTNHSVAMETAPDDWAVVDPAFRSRSWTNLVHDNRVILSDSTGSWANYSVGNMHSENYKRYNATNGAKIVDVKYVDVTDVYTDPNTGSQYVSGWLIRSLPEDRYTLDPGGQTVTLAPNAPRSVFVTLRDLNQSGLTQPVIGDSAIDIAPSLEMDLGFGIDYLHNQRRGFEGFEEEAFTPPTGYKRPVIFFGSSFSAVSNITNRGGQGGTIKADVYAGSALVASGTTTIGAYDTKSFHFNATSPSGESGPLQLSIVITDPDGNMFSRSSSARAPESADPVKIVGEDGTVSTVVPELTAGESRRLIRIASLNAQAHASAPEGSRTHNYSQYENAEEALVAYYGNSEPITREALAQANRVFNDELTVSEEGLSDTVTAEGLAATKVAFGEMGATVKGNLAALETLSGPSSSAHESYRFEFGTDGQSIILTTTGTDRFLVASVGDTNSLGFNEPQSRVLSVNDVYEILDGNQPVENFLWTENQPGPSLDTSTRNEIIDTLARLTTKVLMATNPLEKTFAIYEEIDPYIDSLLEHMHGFVDATLHEYDRQIASLRQHAETANDQEDRLVATIMIADLTAARTLIAGAGLALPNSTEGLMAEIGVGLVAQPVLQSLNMLRHAPKALLERAETIQGVMRHVSGIVEAMVKKGDNVDIRHIVQGTVRGSEKLARGFGAHSQSGIDAGLIRIREIVTPANQQGVYKAYVEVWDYGLDKFVAKTRPSTFFPKEWSPLKITEAIQEVSKNGVKSTKDGLTTYQGVVDGVAIVVRKDADGVLFGYPSL